ncbi:MAG: hypothetical protein OEZ36_03805 [Spirochaetota bacterium]|nr:hypothetical protein [Spirochaetota bacterium]
MKKRFILYFFTFLTALGLFLILFLTSCEDCKGMYDPCVSDAECCGYDMVCAPDIGHCEIPLTTMTQ